MTEFILGLVVGWVAGLCTVILLMIFHIDRGQWNEPWGSSQTED